jgi:aminopeptidase N
MKKLIVLISLVSLSATQAQEFTKQDTLRGSITPERAWWDLSYYDLNVKVQPEEKAIAGYNIIRYKVLEEHDVIQIDLQEPLKITGISQDDQQLDYNKIGPAYFINLKKKQISGEYNELYVQYAGKPKEAVRAPWDGGFSWKKDNNGKHFIATSCQGFGASVWWPNKDHMYDEVDSMRIAIDVPKDLVAVANGRLRETYEYEKGGYKLYEWFVSNPINNYGVNINIGDYVHFGEKYDGEKGVLDLDYYVLRDNLEKAKEQFKDVPRLMKAFEHWFGPYPFYEDSFKLVEVPYLGMEHQSSVTYGNQYQNGYLGRDLSKSGWGMKFDYIIIHEAGHEWFANNITYKDIADMWVHEGFTTYSEALYVDYHFGEQAGNEYAIGIRGNIRNESPIIGVYDVNQRGSGDMYPKGANMLHTLRQVIHDDEKWRSILRGLNKDFYHQTVTTQQVENYISEKAEMDFSKVFDQYLRTIKIPVFEYKIEADNVIKYRYTNVIEGFAMPMRLLADDKELWLEPTTEWQTEKVAHGAAAFKVDPNFYVEVKEL